MMRAVLSPVALACAMACASGWAAAPAQQELPLSGPAYQIADQAYRAYARGDYDAAVRNAREAVRLRPDLARLKTLLQQAQTAARRGRQPRASTAGGRIDRRDIQAAQKSRPSQPADEAAARALQAADRNDLPQASREIAAAIEQAPRVVQYRLLQTDFLIRRQQYDQAEAASTRALQYIDDADDADDGALPAILHGYLLQRRDQYQDARQFYVKALQTDALGDEDMRNLRLIVADAALAAQDHAMAIAALEPLPATDPEAGERRKLAAVDEAASLPLQAPALRCLINRFGPVCSLFAAERPSRTLAAQAYRAAAQGHPRDALALFEQALRIGGANAELAARRDGVRRQLAQEPAAEAYQALADDDAATAERAASQAIAYAPDVMNYRLLLIDALERQEQYAAAERAAGEAIQIDDEDAVPLILRAYLRQRQGNYRSAREDYRQALDNDVLSDDDRRNLRLYVADAATAAADTGLATATLASLAADDKEAAWRRALLDLRQRQRSGPPPLQAPFLDCRVTPYGTVCTAAPAVGAPNALIGAIYRALATKQYDEAVKLARMLHALATANDGYRRVLAQTLTAAGRDDEASRVADGLRNDGPDLGFAYMAAMAGAPELALQTFRQADEAGKLPPQALQNAAFSAINANERQTAVQYFKRAIDAADDGTLKLAPQQLFDTRRAVSELEREWGAYVSASYRGSNNMQAGQNQAATIGDSLQIGTEAYWRPPSLNRDGRYVDLYGRITGTAYSAPTTSTDTRTGNTFSGKPAVGASSLMSAFGVRWKPLASQNLIAAFERQQPLGSAAQGDWLARLGYSYGRGTDLRADADRWNTTQLFAETGYYLQAQTYYFTSELQSGRSYLLPENWGKNTVLWPHAVLAADYNTGYPTPLAVGAGVGVNLRHWWREDHYHAPRSYADLSIQYRRKIAGDERANGWFVRAVFNY
ncbi:bacteriophage N4 adsorption protein A [Herbaspirillum sp. RV1423]|uniref:NfrA family protein n=1 Tax=Herbaspirillum sp. RV1423 TaxID=1443993 RepID=UPI0004BB5BCB|nr:bacteriophage N4 adsorption protein A [Herbaspirillum sp. RV1423]